MTEKKFYITSAIPYVNAKPHIGHALEFVQTNVIARYQKILGKKVLSLSGGDENALKNVQAAEKAGRSVQEFIDTHNKEFQELTLLLNAEYDVWQRGSDVKRHFPSSQKLWNLCQKNGDIYKKKYKGLYCVGCETFYSSDELDENGECYEHPGKKLDEVEEENYFFKLSKYQDKLIELVSSDSLKIIPEKRKNEVLSFLKSGLHDLSISRSNERTHNWGVPVPNDDSQRIYVWFDALNIYQSGIGFGWDENRYKKWWPAEVQVVGKGIIRFHAVYWPAFLLSAGLKPAKSLLVHEYITVDGQKMSKSVGNVYDPVPVLKKYGADSLRYFLLAKLSPFLDGDFSEKKFYSAYNSDLANGLGNAVARVAKLCEQSGFEYGSDNPSKFSSSVKEQLDNYRFDLALAEVWKRLAMIDQKIEKTKPWKLKGKKLKSVLTELVVYLRQIGFDLRPFLPETAEKILKQFKGPKIASDEPLFPRLS